MPDGASVQSVKKSLGLLWYGAGAVVLVILVAGVVLGHSGTFKEQCGERKVAGVSLGWFKNAVCDMDFEIQ